MLWNKVSLWKNWSFNNYRKFNFVKNKNLSYDVIVENCSKSAAKVITTKFLLPNAFVFWVIDRKRTIDEEMHM
jgi:hypothetical protein